MKCVWQMEYMNMNKTASGHMHPHGLEQIMQVRSGMAGCVLAVVPIRWSGLKYFKKATRDMDQ